MSFQNWTFPKSDTTFFAYLGLPGSGFPDSLSAESSSLIMEHRSNAVADLAMVGYVDTTTDSALTLGLLKGTIRTLMRFGDGTTNIFSGLFCMSNNSNSHTLGSIYVAQVNVGTSNNVQVRKATSSGVIGTGLTGTQLGSSASVDFNTVGDIVALELSWNAEEQTTLGGTELILRMGTAQDFSDLVTVVNTIDTSSPLTTAVAEGLFIQIDTVSDALTYFDETRIQVIA